MTKRLCFFSPLTSLNVLRDFTFARQMALYYTQFPLVILQSRDRIRQSADGVLGSQKFRDWRRENVFRDRAVNVICRSESLSSITFPPLSVADLSFSVNMADQVQYFFFYLFLLFLYFDPEFYQLPIVMEARILIDRENSCKPWTNWKFHCNATKPG